MRNVSCLLYVYEKPKRIVLQCYDLGVAVVIHNFMSRISTIRVYKRVHDWVVAIGLK